MIPARYEASRFPGKLMKDLAGKTVILRTYEATKKANLFDEVYVVTDSAIIYNEIIANGGKAIKSKKEHESGSDRIAEAVENLDIDIVVNVQGDEPLIDPLLINQVAEYLDYQKEVFVSTACHSISDYNDFINPNNVKVVLDKNSQALYFSRAPIPFPRDEFTQKIIGRKGFYKHIGIYAYRAKFLKDFNRIGEAELEDIEKLEQLRILYAGYKIGVVQSNDTPSAGVDTPEDLERVRKLFSN